jgi:hypothetical protein
MVLIDNPIGSLYMHMLMAIYVKITRRWVCGSCSQLLPGCYTCHSHLLGRVNTQQRREGIFGLDWA